MVRVFELAKEYQVPVLIHFQYEMYNHGFERFYNVLERKDNRYRPRHNELLSPHGQTRFH